MIAYSRAPPQPLRLLARFIAIARYARGLSCKCLSVLIQRSPGSRGASSSAKRFNGLLRGFDGDPGRCADARTLKGLLGRIMTATDWTACQQARARADRPAELAAAARLRALTTDGHLPGDLRGGGSSWSAPPSATGVPAVAVSHGHSTRLTGLRIIRTIRVTRTQAPLPVKRLAFEGGFEAVCMTRIPLPEFRRRRAASAV